MRILETIAEIGIRAKDIHSVTVGTNTSDAYDSCDAESATSTEDAATTPPNNTAVHLNDLAPTIFLVFSTQTNSKPPK